MNKIMERVIKKSGKQLCGMAKMAAVISVNSCRGFFISVGEDSHFYKW